MKNAMLLLEYVSIIFATKNLGKQTNNTKILKRLDRKMKLQNRNDVLSSIDNTKLWWRVTSPVQ